MVSKKTYDDVMEFDTLVSLDATTSTETGIQRPDNVEVGCVIKQICDLPVPKLEFHNKSDGALIAIVPKTEFCISNGTQSFCRKVIVLGYFQGMFGNEFMEQKEDRQIFLFDEDLENVCVDDFRKFLHYLSGCQNPSDCVHVDSVETTCSLLHVFLKSIYT